MTYSIIQPPFTLQFREMSKPELRQYYEWFMAVTPERVAGLEASVRESFPDWRADGSPDSLKILGAWFSENVDTRAKTQEEIDEQKGRLTFPVDIPTEQLTNKSFSLAMDIGMYFAQVVLKNMSGTSWAQSMTSKTSAYYGQPVIMGFGKVPLNPIRIGVTLAYGFASKDREGNRLREVYDVWDKMRR